MALAIQRTAEGFLYQQVIDLIRDMHSNDTLRAGDKLPSLRSLSKHLDVSIPTIKQAYIELERQGLVKAREKSGYYLVSQTQNLPIPHKAKASHKGKTVSRAELIEQVFQGIHSPGVVPLGVANPVGALPPTKALNRTLRRVMTLAGDNLLLYGPMEGHEGLRRQLALSYLACGLKNDMDDIVITNGAQEALNIALRSVAKPGDVIAVESPCYFGLLELIESLGMLALEIPLCAEKGLVVADVKKAIDAQPVAACLFSSTIANPLGCPLSIENKAALVKLLEERDIPLIEDDVYGDLQFDLNPLTPAQQFSQKGLVITCGSFSKTVAPSYRVGWVVSQKYSGQHKQLKRGTSCSTSLQNQWVLTEFLQSGEYSRYNKLLRQTLQTNKDRMRALILQHFPKDIRITNPIGGSVIWLEMPKSFDASLLFTLSLAAGISLCPGAIFASDDRYRHCFRLSYGLPWTKQVEQALIKLAELVKTLHSRQ